MQRIPPGILLLMLLLLLLPGCKYPEITAVPLSPWNQCVDAEGIPFYLPKPLLIVSKNFRNIEESKVGLTATAPIPNGFDDQSKYADANARTSFNSNSGTAPSSAATNTGTAQASGQILHSGSGAPVTPGDIPGDGLTPETFYTYQIVFVPDLTQKYGLKIKGGAGEMRAAMNLVNGWQYTGMGPYYMKDSSTAQNILAGGISANLTGQGVADVVSSVADLAGSLQTGEATDPSNPRVQHLTKTMDALPLSVQPMILDNFAEIHVYEPNVTPDGMMMWSEIVCLSFDRHALGTRRSDVTMAPATVAGKSTTDRGGLQAGESKLGRAVVANALGIPADSPALREVSPGGLQSGESATLAGPGPITQVQVDYGDNHRKPRQWDLFGFGHHRHKRRPKIETRRATGIPGFGTSASPATTDSSGGGSAAPPGQGGGLQSAEAAASGSTRTTISQPIINQPVMDPDTFRKLLIPADREQTKANDESANGDAKPGIE